MKKLLILCAFLLLFPVLGHTQVLTHCGDGSGGTEVCKPNPLTIEVAVALLFDGSLETQIAPTNLGASQAITITGPGRIEKVCLIFTTGTLLAAEDGSVIFFDTDPVITIDTAGMTVAEADTIVVIVPFLGADYLATTTAQTRCLDLDTHFHAITHVVYTQQGAGTLTDEDVGLHLWYARD